MKAAPAQHRRRPTIMAVVTTLNEEENIADCLQSLMWCDELLVVDSFSADRTPEIVAGFPAVRFEQRTYLGAASQKNWAMDQVSCDWALFFDADERCTPELRREIEELLAQGPDRDAYIIRRQAYFLGRRIRFSGWQHDRVVRLVRRGAGRYPNQRVHAEMLTRTPPRPLRSPMLHYMVDSLDEYFARLNRYAHWGAAERWRRGRRAGFLDVAFRPVWRFIRTFFLNLGFLDGMTGVVFCMLQSYSTFAKWSILWGWHRNALRGKPPQLPPFDDDERTWSWDDDSPP